MMLMKKLIRKLKKLYYKFALIEHCANCSKRIPNGEWANNWGICDECWEKIYEVE